MEDNPLNSPTAAAPQPHPTGYPDPTVVAQAQAAPAAPYIPLAVPASQPQPGDPGTLTVTATAVMPQPAVPEAHAPIPAFDNVEASAPDEPPKDATGWALARFYAWKYLGTLVMEQAHGGTYVMGLGRLAFVVVFGLAVWTWGSGKDIPEGAQEMLYVLLGYILGNRGIAVVQQLITAKHGDPYGNKAGGRP